METQRIHRNADFSYQDSLRSVNFPLYQTAAFGHIGLGRSSGFDYTREKNPTRQRLEETVSALENAWDMVAFSSVLGADLVIHSGSKFISGHNDTIVGFLSSSDQ